MNGHTYTWSNNGSTKARLLTHVDDRQKYQNTAAYFTYHGTSKTSSVAYKIEIRTDMITRNLEKKFYFIGDTHKYNSGFFKCNTPYSREELLESGLPDINTIVDNLTAKIGEQTNSIISDQQVDIHNTNNLKKMAIAAEEKRTEDALSEFEPEEEDSLDDSDESEDLSSDEPVLQETGAEEADSDEEI